jgi:hypothetical protein
MISNISDGGLSKWIVTWIMLESIIIRWKLGSSKTIWRLIDETNRNEVVR